MALTEIESAEQLYWYGVVEESMREVADWNQPLDAVDALLKGTHHESIAGSDEFKYPIMRWRQLDKKAKIVKKTPTKNDRTILLNAICQSIENGTYDWSHENGIVIYGGIGDPFRVLAISWKVDR